MVQLRRALDRARYRFGRLFIRKSPAAPPDAPTLVITMPSQNLLEQINEYETQYHIIRRLWAVPSMRLPKYWNRRRLWEQVDELETIISQLDDHKRGIEEMMRLLSKESPTPPLRRQTSLRRRKANASSSSGTAGPLPITPTDHPVESSLLARTEETTPSPPTATVGSLLNGYLESLQQTRKDVVTWRCLLGEIADAV